MCQGNTIWGFRHYLCHGGIVCTLAVTLFVFWQYYLCLGGTICGLGGTPVACPRIGIGTGLGIGVEGARRTQYARGATLRRPMRKVREGRREDNPEHAPPPAFSSPKAQKRKGRRMKHKENIKRRSQIKKHQEKTFQEVPIARHMYLITKRLLNCSNKQKRLVLM